MNFFLDPKEGEHFYNSYKEVSLLKNEAKLGTELLEPGMKTTLDGFLKTEVEFMGFIDQKTMVFYIGYIENLFETKHYFKVIYWISPNRFYIQFAPKSGRDFNFINGQWK